MRVGGIVLCGGNSTRMGRPKAWLPVGSETMLARTVRVVAEVVSPVVVVAAAGQELPPVDALVVRDERANCGPLAGIAAGLANLHADAAFITACDVPFLRAAFVRRLVELYASPLTAVHPLAGVWSVELLALVREHLAADRLAVRDLLAAVPTRFLVREAFADVDPAMESCLNANTPAEYDAVRRAWL